jgi:hypothetical protein
MFFREPFAVLSQAEIGLSRVALGLQTNSLAYALRLAPLIASV